MHQPAAISPPTDNTCSKKDNPGEPVLAVVAVVKH
jgi:hypothetical protein